MHSLLISTVTCPKLTESQQSMYVQRVSRPDFPFAGLTMSYKVLHRDDHSVQNPSQAAILQSSDQHLPVVLRRTDDLARHPGCHPTRPRATRLRQWYQRRTRPLQQMGNAGASDCSICVWARQLGLSPPCHQGLHRGEKKAREEGRQDELGPGSAQRGDGGVEQEVRHFAWDFLSAERRAFCGHGHLRCHTGGKDPLSLRLEVATSMVDASALTWLVIVLHSWTLFAIVAHIDAGEPCCTYKLDCCVSDNAGMNRDPLSNITPQRSTRCCPTQKQTPERRCCDAPARRSRE